MTALVPLSALDHLLANEILTIQLAFEYPSKLDPKRLIESFHATAQRFVGIGATLTRADDHTLAFDVSRDVSEIRVTHDQPELPLHACVDALRHELGQPLARARIVDRGSRGTAVGFSMSHVVADGYGFFLFLAAWAAAARGAEFPAPNCDRTALTNPAARGPAQPSSVTGPLEHSGFVLREHRSAVRFQLEDRLLPLAKVREEKQREPGNYTTADLVSALLWKQAMERGDFEHTTLTCPVDLRRYRDALGPLYFGNAFLHATLTLPLTHVQTTSAPALATRIHGAIEAVPTRIDAALSELEALWSSRGLDILPRVYPYPLETGFYVSNMSRVTLDMLDFGAGPATRFEFVPGTAYGRLCFVLPAGDDLRLLMALQPL